MKNLLHSNGIIKWNNLTGDAFHDNGLKTFSKLTGDALIYSQKKERTGQAPMSDLCLLLTTSDELVIL